MTSEDQEPIVRTSPKRMAQGIIIIVATLAVGAAIIVPFFNDMFKIPPPVSQIPVTPVEGGEEGGEGGGAVPAGTTMISILQGAAVQGSPDYDPDEAEVPLGNKIVWDNQDSVPHTATSGTGPTDPNSGKLFDTSIIDGGAKSDPIDTSEMKEGDSITYYCTVHPYMVSKLTITAASEGGEGEGGAGAGTTTGPLLTIPVGAVNPGSTPYEPAAMTAKKGDEINVANKDSAPHTVTSGTGPEDSESGKLFDTSIIDAGGSGKISTADLTPGEHPFYCAVHPFMKGTLKVE